MHSACSMLGRMMRNRLLSLLLILLLPWQNLAFSQSAACAHSQLSNPASPVALVDCHGHALSPDPASVKPPLTGPCYHCQCLVYDAVAEPEAVAEQFFSLEASPLILPPLQAAPERLPADVERPPCLNA